MLADQDACTLAQMSDCAVLVARWGNTRRQDLGAAAGG